MRRSGILLHITSLPSPFGIGDLGPGADEFLQFLEQSGQKVWQVLPLNPTDPIFDNSPYSSCSAFAGNTLLISPELLMQDGLLNEEELQDHPEFSSQRVEFEKAIPFKQKLLDAAFKRFKPDEAYDRFLDEQGYWLKDYADYLTDRNRREHAGQIYFEQYCFFKQWFDFKERARRKDVAVMGDIPIYVNYDSVDVWRNPKVFKLNKKLEQEVVAGVPPDYFSATGQRWGNPVYDWDYLKKTDFKWWIMRLRHNLSLCDILRIDHFRAFVNYWEIPADAPTAVDGHWVDVPTDDFFAKVKEEFPDAPIVAEDLGQIDRPILEKIHSLGFPGMKILMFAFAEDLKRHMYLPHNYEANCVVYTGTHDNNTIRGWFDEDATSKERSNFLKYIFHEAPKSIHWEMIRLALESRANLALIPMQDVLGLGKGARMNTPGSCGGNWRWRLEAGQLNSCLAKRLAAQTAQTQR